MTNIKQFDTFLLAQTLGQSLVAHGWSLVTAESCTGGWIAKAITDIPGSSQWFECGFVTYSNESKQKLLGVTADALTEHGAVSEAVVIQMVTGALARSRAQVAIAVSGIAGPDGGTIDKPVGTVWLAWGMDNKVRVERKHFIGSREAVRNQTVQRALEGLTNILAF